MSLQGRDFLSLHDFTTEEIYEFLKTAQELKAKVKAGQEHHLLKGKTLGMIFQKSSTRTRVSFEVGMYQLGGQALFLSSHDLQIGRGEPIRDTARVLSRYLNGIMIRTYSHKEVLELAQYADIPIINGLTDYQHPCQALADLQTILEHKGTLKGLKMAYIGDGNNMAHSLMHAGAKVGMDVFVASPHDYAPSAIILDEAREAASAFGSQIKVVTDPLAAAEGADVIYTDVWASMGQEAEQAKRVKDFAGFCVDERVMKVAKSDAIVLHCLPAHRGEEISEEVFESKNSVVFDEAENRLHAQKAIMARVMAN